MRVRRTPSIRARLLAGLFIVIATVVIFSVVMSPRQATPAATATAIPTSTTVAAAAVTSSPAATVARQAIYRVIAEKINMDAEITQVHFNHLGEWDVDNLNQFAGHLEGTADLGQGGNFVLAGHVELKDGTHGPFISIGELKSGDQISIIGSTSKGLQVRRYIVTQVVKVAPDALDVVRNHGYEELTLITCSDYTPQNNTYNTRLVVHARLNNVQ